MLWRWHQLCPGSAAQPASASGGAEQPSFMEFEDDQSEETVAFYNVGIQRTEVGTRKLERKTEDLKQDIVNASSLYGLDMLCLCEVGAINAGLEAKTYRLYTNSIAEWIRNLLADTDVSQAVVYADAQDVTIVNKMKFDDVHDAFVSDFISAQRERFFQHLRLRLRASGKLVSVINCHAPSSKKRKLTNQRRLRYFQEFHTRSGADPVIWGGDFNTGAM